MEQMSGFEGLFVKKIYLWLKSVDMWVSSMLNISEVKHKGQTYLLQLNCKT